MAKKRIAITFPKNFGIWPKMARMSIFGYMFFGHNSAIFGPIELGTQETIIYRLVVRNLSYDAYFSFLIFWATFGGKMGVGTTCAPFSLGPPNPTKKLAH